MLMKKIRKIFSDHRQYFLLKKVFHQSLPKGLYRNTLIAELILNFSAFFFAIFLLVLLVTIFN